MENNEFQELILTQFAKMNERFDKMDERFDKMDERFDRVESKLSAIGNKQDEHGVRLEAIEGKQKEHDIRFDNLDRNIDIIAKWTKQLLDNENEVTDLFVKRKMGIRPAF